VIVDQRVIIAAPVDQAWDFLMDVAAVGRCVPGVESIQQIDEDNYAGTLHVRIGPISLNLEGRLVIAERDPEQRRMQLNVEAADRRIRGAVNARTTIRLEEVSANRTDLVVHTDAAILGKLGEFGQAVMHKKADQIIGQFAQNVSRQLEGSHSGGSVAG
jgi:carbon monoxide dehydrogenase subunit G